MASLSEIQSELYEDCPYSNFPVAVDTITRKKDLDLATKTLLDQYYTYINAGDFSAATALLNDNPNLRMTVMVAEDYNRMRDGIIAVQRVFDSYIADYIAAVVKSKGAWSSTTQYQKYDVVTYLYRDATRTYICLPQDETLVTIPVGTLPTDTTYWALITLEGSRGASGTGMTPRGTYASDIQYYKDDLVAHNGLLYVALQDVYGEAPPSGKWELLALNSIDDAILPGATIAVTDWGQDKTYTITNANITDSVVAQVFFNKSSLEAAALAGIIVETYNGGIRLTYTGLAPTGSIVIDYIRIRKEIVG